MATHYEWWAKAGGGPGYSSKIEREIYIKDFNWLSNWIDKHFFNKVSDTLLGIIFICFLFIFSMHYYFRKRKNKIVKFNLLFYFLPLFFLVEWFLNHPSMRYGGYVLFAIPIFLFVSNFLEKYKVDKKKLERLTLIFIILTYSVFVTRNLIRIEKEIDIYGYNLIKSPFFYIKNINSYEIYNENKFKIYSTKNNQMCWASPTPCSYSKNLKVDKFLWMNLVYKNDK